MDALQVGLARKGKGFSFFSHLLGERQSVYPGGRDIERGPTPQHSPVPARRTSAQNQTTDATVPVEIAVQSSPTPSAPEVEVPQVHIQIHLENGGDTNSDTEPDVHADPGHASGVEEDGD